MFGCRGAQAIHKVIQQRHHYSATGLHTGDYHHPSSGLTMGKLRAITILGSILLLSSCSCMRILVGILVDRETQEPIHLAEIRVTNKGYERHFESDSTGYFRAYIQGGPKCPRIQAQISAAGYQVINVVEPRNGDTLTYYLDKFP